MPTKKKVLEPTNEIIQYCDKLTAKGQTLSLNWDGGNDSGWVYFKIDDKEVQLNDNPIVDKLIDYCYDELDYGSWAGDFSAHGEAVYDANEKAFIGTDYYGEEETINHDCKVVVSVPADVWFDQVEIQTEYDSDYYGDPTCLLVVQNGFKTPEHEKVEKALTESLKKQFDEELDQFAANNEYRGFWDDFTIARSEFKAKGKTLQHTITAMGVRTEHVEDKDIYLDLTEKFTHVD